jgi:PIN domain nuclease of toxin-antitoxin system
VNLLLDTHIVIWTIDRSLPRRYPNIQRLIAESGNSSFVSAASLWEINIKLGVGKLKIDMDALEIPDFLMSQGLYQLGIAAEHALANVVPEPPTRDPFDRLLLAQAQIEGMRFVTVDRALADHPVTFR